MDTSDILTVGVAISIGLLILAKVLPNEKVYAFGFKIGSWLSTFGALRCGAAWNKLEDFMINSGGQFFKGFKDGLNSDET